MWKLCNEIKKLIIPGTLRPTLVDVINEELGHAPHDHSTPRHTLLTLLEGKRVKWATNLGLELFSSDSFIVFFTSGLINLC